MVTCPRCSTGQALDSLFCRKCGAEIPESAREAARGELLALVGEGEATLKAGRADEALAIAEAALDKAPNEPATLALAMESVLALGRRPEALAYADRLVEARPDSELDRIRRDHLRETLSMRLAGPDPEQRRLAIFAGFSVAVLVAGGGFFLSRLVENRPAPVAMPLPPLVASTPVVEPTPLPVETPKAEPSPKSTPGPDDVPALTERPATAAPAAERPAPRAPLPAPSEGEEVSVKPLEPFPRGAPKLPDSQAPLPRDPSGDPVPAPVAATPRPKGPVAGEISITLSGGPRRGNTRPAPAPSPASELGGARSNQTVGLDQYQGGNYAGAAASFERALAAGGDPVSLNQRLGQAYDRLGRSGDAAVAYRRAVSACESALASGKGDTARLQRTLESCQAALSGRG